MVKFRRSRLRRKEERRNLRRAIIFGSLTVILALALVFLGIPALIRMAIFLGNLRSSSLPVETQDALPPAPPRLRPLPEATNSAQITLQGFAEPGSTVEIFIGEMSTKKIVAENDGTFTASGIKLALGRNEITATATDEAGNLSQQSDKIIIAYDETPPELAIDEPSKGADLFGEKNKVIVKGRTEEGAEVRINERIVIVDSEGNFEYPLRLSEGNNLIRVVAVDKAGNKTKKEIKVIYTP